MLLLTTGPYLQTIPLANGFRMTSNGSYNGIRDVLKMLLYHEQYVPIDYAIIDINSFGNMFHIQKAFVEVIIRVDTAKPRFQLHNNPVTPVF